MTRSDYDWWWGGVSFGPIGSAHCMTYTEAEPVPERGPLGFHIPPKPKPRVRVKAIMATSPDEGEK